MVAIGRALMSQPDMLLLDEPSLGLAPITLGELFDALAKMRETGAGLLLVEQNVKASLAWRSGATSWRPAASSARTRRRSFRRTKPCNVPSWASPPRKGIPSSGEVTRWIS
ncbi:hypothetical protein [Pelagibius marinus]|uniref:hypothetical protein n=1 Tax=Pelagibius marinus TaxID=2762760 RepID=UPI00221F8D99|nr:hypothetical protein [Pelagibius marinus]